MVKYQKINLVIFFIQISEKEAQEAEAKAKEEAAAE